VLHRIKLLREASLEILQGNKIPFQTTNTSVRSRYSKLLNRMYAAHLIAAEPQTYIVQPEFRDVNGKYLGQTFLHPLSTALYDEAVSLRDMAIQKGKPVSQVDILGLDQSKRNNWRTGEAYVIAPGRIGVLTRADNVALEQALSIIEERSKDSKVSYTSPLIIENNGHFWEGLFNTKSAKWSKRKAELRALNIHYSSGPAQTADLLASIKFGKKINPQDMVFNLGGNFGLEDPHFGFVTTDQIKTEQTIAAQKESGAKGRVVKSIDVLGPSAAPEEEAYSIEGNAEQIKFKAHYYNLKRLGRETVERRHLRHGLDINNKIDMTNDGGLGFCLENAAGERRIDLFTEEFFPNSMHRMNPIQMSPGVELAYLKRTDGLEISMQRLFARVDQIVAEDKRFKREDLCAYDIGMYVAAPVSRMLDAIDAGEDYNAGKLGVVSVFTTQKLQVSEIPKFAPGQGQRVPETENYLIPPGETQTRAELPGWELHGPNATAFRLLRDMIGAKAAAPDMSAEQANKRKYPLSMGMLGTPDALLSLRGSDGFTTVKNLLMSEFGIATKQGPGFWRDYKRSPDDVMSAVLRGVPSNRQYLSGMRDLLDRSSVLYFGKAKERPLTDAEKVTNNLLLVKAIVRNQVFNPIPIVAERGPAADVLKLLEHKQMLGLVGQKTHHLINLVDTPEEAAAKISEIANADSSHRTPVQRSFYSDGQVENKQCMVATAYFSATNCNKTYDDIARRVGYLYAVNAWSAKVGGGNDGLMKSFSDGFLEGKAELEAKGYDFPNQLILIQCVDTEAIEMPYEGGGIYRCHKDIEDRKLDLQTTDFPFAGPGGMGSDEEILGQFQSRLMGLTKTPFTFLNPTVDSPQGKVGPYDPYREIFSPEFLKQMDTNWVSTPEGLIDLACTYRDSQAKTHLIPVESLRDTLTGHANRAYGVMSIKKFRPPWDVFLGQKGDIPLASGFADPVPRDWALQKT
jgi:predicted Rossmann-fold nucleotide-binding protein